MRQDIRHRRLYAFYQSKVLNTLMIVTVISLMQIGYLQSMVMPVICSSVSLALFIGYSLWLWIRKPKQITIDTWLSNLSIWFTLYFVVVVAMKDLTQWWYIFPIVAAIILMFINLVRPHDELFDIVCESGVE
ncbi:MAG: hypothetical protein NC405_04020 [Odoribacter sp.]|nr:hypothetical protein [Odoribacter sp.]